MLAVAACDARVLDRRKERAQEIVSTTSCVSLPVRRMAKGLRVAVDVVDAGIRFDRRVTARHGPAACSVRGQTRMARLNAPFASAGVRELVRSETVLLPKLRPTEYRNPYSCIVSRPIELYKVHTRRTQYISGMRT